MGIKDFFANLGATALDTLGIPPPDTGPQLGSVDTTALISNQITAIVQTNITSCLAPVEADQVINMTCDPDPTLAAEFLNSYACQSCQAQFPTDPILQQSQCSICFACVATDISQNLVVQYNPAACSPFGPNVAQITTLISADIQKQITSKSTWNAAATSWTNAIKIPNVTKNLTVFTQQINNLITADDVTQVLMALKNQQVVSIQSKGGSVQSGVTQSTVTFQISKVVAQKMQQIGVSNATDVANVSASPETRGQQAQQATYSLIIYSTAAVVAILLIVMIALTFTSPVKAPPQPPAGLQGPYPPYAGPPYAPPTYAVPYYGPSYGPPVH